MKRNLPTGEVAQATKLFDKFFAAEDFEDILMYHQGLCDVLQICPGSLSSVYNVIKANVRSLCAINLFQVLDKKVKNECYSSQFACAGLEVVIVGCGPCGLRTAIEAQLHGARVNVIEKRTSFTRNNVLHLWPFVIEDLKMLGTKNFFPKFCTGSMNHISIRRLQSILLKVALVFGVQVYKGVEFCDLSEPDDTHESSGWRINVNPTNHPINLVNVDVLIGAEGKRVTVPGFKRKEFRGKLAIAITANFVNNRTTAEAVVEEISGVAFLYKQDFFNSLYEELCIALENIVYFKDETHYFVMTSKKHSLLDRGVLLKDCKDPVELLSQKNVNKPALLEYIKDACDFCTDYQLPDLEFALNHHGEADVALFDFTSMFAASNSCYVKEKHGKQILLGLVGDGLLEPFWPTGSGCARGFLGALDTCHTLQEWCEGNKSVLQLLAERESIFRLLPQTTSENIAKDFKNYTPNPSTRYPNLNKYLYSTHQMSFLYITDNEEHADLPRSHYMNMESNRPTAGPSRLLRLQQRQRRPDSLEYEDDSPSRSEIAQQQELRRKKLLAEEKEKQNDPGQYYSNRAKMLREQSAGQLMKKKSEGGGVDKPERVNRLEAMAKISQTFGYGEVPKAPHQAKSQPVKKSLPQQPQQQHQKALPESKAKKKPTSSKPKTEQPVQKAKQQRQGVKQWNFSKPSGSTDSNPIEVDPELDGMLAQLEMDADFMNMSDNEQIAWLESLFFLDTPSNQACRGLVKPRPKEVAVPKRPKPVVNAPRSASKRSGFHDTPDTGIPSVSTKSMAIQSNSGKMPPAKEDTNCPPGLNKDMCALAQSFFANDNKGKKPPSKPVSRKASLVDGNLPAVQNATPKPFAKPPPERAYFQPTGQELPEEDVMPAFQLKSHTPVQSHPKPPEPVVEDAPPVPTRSGEPKALMLRLMKSATNALRS